MIYVIIEQLIAPPSALKICPQFYMCWESFQYRTPGPNLKSKGLKVPELKKCCFNNEFSKLKISKGSGARKPKKSNFERSCHQMLMKIGIPHHFSKRYAAVL